MFLYKVSIPNILPSFTTLPDGVELDRIVDFILDAGIKHDEIKIEIVYQPLLKRRLQ